MSHAQRKLRRRKIVDFIQAGGSSSEACVEFGVSSSTVIYACREAGVKAPYEGRAKSLDSFRVLWWLLKGMRPSEIALKKNVSRARVSQIARKAREAGFDL